MSQSSKKKTARKGSAKRPTVRERAERFINSDHPSYATRKAIKNALEDNDSNLAELIRRAESGEEILDITREPLPPPPETRPNSLTTAEEVANNLTFDELKRIAFSIADLGDQDEMLNLILLCTAIAHGDNSRRQSIVNDVRGLYAPYLSQFDRFIDGLTIQQAKRMRAGAEA
jgi:hypothetical protein